MWLSHASVSGQESPDGYDKPSSPAHDRGYDDPQSVAFDWLLGSSSSHGAGWLPAACWTGGVVLVWRGSCCIFSVVRREATFSAEPTRSAHRVAQRKSPHSWYGRSAAEHP